MARLNASCWLIVHCNSKILLLKRSKNSNNSGQWNLPGGGMEEGEDPRKSIIREAREEAGLKIKTAQLMLLGKVKDKKTKHVAYFFVCSMDKKPKVKINFESSRHDWFELSKFPKPLHFRTKLIYKSMLRAKKEQDRLRSENAKFFDS